MPDRPNPSNDYRSCDKLEETNKEGTAVPSHVEVVRLEHGADAGEENVNEQ